MFSVEASVGRRVVANKHHRNLENAEAAQRRLPSHKKAQKAHYQFVFFVPFVAAMSFLRSGDWPIELPIRHEIPRQLLINDRRAQHLYRDAILLQQRVVVSLDRHLF